MNPPKIKICGLTRKNQAISIAEMGVDAIGFIFYTSSPRYVRPDIVADITCNLPPFTGTVGVFVNEEPTQLIDIYRKCQLNLVQLSGEESPEYCKELDSNHISWIKGIRVRNNQSLSDLERYGSKYFLLDAWSASDYGGTGKTFNWDTLSGMDNSYQIILAGGINADNVIEAIQTTKPYAIDVSSGVEVSPGVKSISEVKRLLEAMISADLG